MLLSELCDYSDAYTVNKGIITVKENDKIDRINRLLAFKNNALFNQINAYQISIMY